MVLVAPMVVDGASRLALSYGLFSVLTPRPEGDGRWQNGITWEPLSCGPASGVGAFCPTDENGDPIEQVGLPKGFNDNPDETEASPFTVIASYNCSPVGRSIEEGERRARAILAAREEAMVERTLWTGELGNTPNLQDEATDITPGGAAVDPVQAIGLLEEANGQNYGSQGVIHLTRAGAIAGIGAYVLFRDGARLVTGLGTPVIAGAGYPGTSPAGVAADPGESWGYVTPALIGYRSEVFTPSNRQGDLLDRGVNQLMAMAERSYVLGWDPCGVSAVNLTTTCC